MELTMLVVTHDSITVGIPLSLKSQKKYPTTIVTVLIHSPFWNSDTLIRYRPIVIFLSAVLQDLKGNKSTGINNPNTLKKSICTV